QPHQDQHGWDAALGGVVQVDIVQVAVPAAGKGARDVGGDVIVEVQLDALGTNTEERVAFDHLQAGAPGDDAKLVRIDTLGFEDRREAIFHRGRRREVGNQDDDRHEQYERAAPEPDQVEAGDSHGNPDAAGLAEQNGHGDERGAGEPDPEALAQV